MAGQWNVSKPSRSDEVLDQNEQLQIANQIRAQFDSMVPKRPTKPSRSESDTTSTPTTDIDQHNIPELDRLRSFQSQPSVLFSAEGANMEQDEFVETQYYKELDSIDKQHHSTGSGFIKVVMEGESELSIVGDGTDAAGGRKLGCCYWSNAATNDWTCSTFEEDLASYCFFLFILC